MDPWLGDDMKTDSRESTFLNVLYLSPPSIRNRPLTPFNLRGKSTNPTWARWEGETQPADNKKWFICVSCAGRRILSNSRDELEEGTKGRRAIKEEIYEEVPLLCHMGACRSPRVGCPAPLCAPPLRLSPSLLPCPAPYVSFSSLTLMALFCFFFFFVKSFCDHFEALPGWSHFGLYVVLVLQPPAGASHISSPSGVEIRPTIQPGI